MAGMDIWVSDKLQEVLGMSDKYVCQYLIALAQKAPDPDVYIERIKETDTIDVDQKVAAFAKELWSKVRLFLTLC